MLEMVAANPEQSIGWSSMMTTRVALELSDLSEADPALLLVRSADSGHMVQLLAAPAITDRHQSKGAPHVAITNIAQKCHVVSRSFVCGSLSD
jgi:hypothetical protein